MRIIPAIDIIDGKCVRLTRGDYKQVKQYYDDPVELARQFEDNGLRYLHLVDLDGARSRKIINWKILERISVSTGLTVDFGGGIKSTGDLKIAFESGAAQVTAGSVASKDPGLFLNWLDTYGPGKIILGADCKNRIIMTDGWTSASETDVVDYIIAYQEKGISSVICTDIEKDGTLTGPSFELYKEIISGTGISLVASGGINSMDDLDRLKELGCEGAIMGKAIYEGNINIKQLGRYAEKENNSLS